MSTMNRVAIENVMIARRTPQVVLDVRCQGVQQRKRPFTVQPLRDNDFVGGLWCQAPR